MTKRVCIHNHLHSRYRARVNAPAKVRPGAIAGVVCLLQEVISTDKALHSHPPSKWPHTDTEKLTECWILNDYKWPKQHLEFDPMEGFLAQPKTPSLQHAKSNASLNMPSETSLREAKSRPYIDKNYEVFLESKGIFLDDHKHSIASDRKTWKHPVG
ncbi:hypothetical protein CISG_10215 [Coccidioides immitis RMSCC 3703]|uniref:Uncharacterized protein n=1 Tax=Coccidioides immitis RMSCC 3703 TaxID=454286 RepID=A0A0J8QRE8_COCIT|nr:hypothetical protein CISG_10215 [Coccidioides immitis RMSCC 3703]